MRLQILLLSLVVFLNLPAMAYENLVKLTTPPLDTAEARRVRIWFPIENHNFCQVTVNILNKSNRVICHLIKRQFFRGYYNLYWDKKDDSGRFVEEGKYRYLISYCEHKDIKPIIAQYKKGERECKIELGKDLKNPTFNYEIKTDSVIISLAIYNNRGKLVFQPFVDSLVTRGKHTFVWHPDKDIRAGNYTFKLRVFDFVNIFELRYKK